jgi:hypothetical protein
MNNPAKKGYDFGLLPEAQKLGKPMVSREGSSYKNLPADRDQVVWNDPCNFETHLAASTPMDGLDATVWELFKGKVNNGM